MNRYLINQVRENERIPLEKLMGGALSSTPVNFDFGKGYAELWDYYAAVQCENCGKWAYGSVGENDECEVCNGYISANPPVMNCYYPLPDIEPRDYELKWAARRLSGVPLVFVTLNPGEDETYGLALTGGGMDLSWEICEAFTNIGYLPPMEFINLPIMAGNGESEMHRYVIAACKESATVTIARAQRGIDRLNEQYPAEFIDTPGVALYEERPEPEVTEDDGDDFDDEEDEDDKMY